MSTVTPPVVAVSVDDVILNSPVRGDKSSPIETAGLAGAARERTIVVPTDVADADAMHLREGFEPPRSLTSGAA
jgi:hypothetical protein